MSTGWTWDYVENNIDMLRLNALWEVWKITPPINKSMAAYIGYKAPVKKQPRPDWADEPLYE